MGNSQATHDRLTQRRSIDQDKYVVTREDSNSLHKAGDEKTKNPDITYVCVPVHVECFNQRCIFDERFKIEIKIGNHSVQDLVNQCLVHLNSKKKYNCYKFGLDIIADDSFTGAPYASHAYDETDHYKDPRLHLLLRRFHKGTIQKHGLHIIVQMTYIHLPVHISKVSNFIMKNKNIVSVDVNPSDTIKEVIDKFIKLIQRINHPKLYSVCDVYWSTVGNQFSLNKECDFRLCKYKTDIILKGLTIEILPKAEHTVFKQPITCKYMISNTATEHAYDPLSCPIYKSLKIKYMFTEKNLLHLSTYTHFTDEYKGKPACTYGDQCYAHKRLESGEYRLDDRCHVKLFRHPPRRQRINLAEDFRIFNMNKSWIDNHDVYEPTKDDYKKYGDHKTGFLNALIEECIMNGFKHELCMKNEDDIKTNTYS
eukprot:28479_1